MGKAVAAAAVMILVLACVAPSEAAVLKFDTPQDTFNTWMDQMEQNPGKHEYVKMCYSQELLELINHRVKDPAGVRAVDGAHRFMMNAIADYVPGEPEEISDDEAVIVLTHKETGETREIRFVYEHGAWKIDNPLPAFGSESAIGGHMLVILGVVLLIVILVLAKKVLLT